MIHRVLISVFAIVSFFPGHSTHAKQKLLVNNKASKCRKQKVVDLQTEICHLRDFNMSLFICDMGGLFCLKDIEDINRTGQLDLGIICSNTL